MKTLLSLSFILTFLTGNSQSKKIREEFKKEMDTVLYCHKAMYGISPFDETADIADTLKEYIAGEVEGVYADAWALVFAFEKKLDRKIKELLSDKKYSSIQVYDTLKKYFGHVDEGPKGQIKIIQFENNDGGTMRGFFRTTVLTALNGKKIMDTESEYGGDQTHVYDIKTLFISDTAEYYLVFDAIKGCSTCFYDGVNVTVIKKDTAYMYAPLFYRNEKFESSAGIAFRGYSDHNSIEWNEFTRALEYENTNEDFVNDNGLPEMKKGKYVFNGYFFVHVEEQVPQEWIEEYQKDDE